MRLLALLVSVLAFVSTPADASTLDYWVLESMDVQIDVMESGSLHVYETITADFAYPRHGIFRYVPYLYSKDWGLRHITDVSLISLMQDGEAAPFSSTQANGNVMWKVGHEDVEIEGRHVYEFEYIVHDALLYHDEYDELYWNVTGNDWDVQVRNASVVVSLPGGATPVNVSCWTGDYHSTAQNCVVAGNAVVADSGPLTVSYEFAKGLVEEPSGVATLMELLWDNIVAVVGLLLIPIPFILWYRNGRDVRVGAIGPEYEPPTGYRAAHLVAIGHGSRKHMIAAMVVTMAQEGYVRILAEETKGLFGARETISLEKLREPDGLDVPHKALFNALFRRADEKGVAKLTGRSGLLDSHTIRRITDGLRQKWVDDGYYAAHSFRWQDAMTGIGILGIVGGIMFVGWTENVGFLLWSLAGVATLIAGYFIPRLTHQGAEFYRRVLGFKMFMHKAERFRSAWQEKQSMFTDYLSYAIAFGDVHRWAKAFEGTQAANTPPTWYVGYYAAWSYLNFATSMTALEGAVAAAMPSSRGGGSSGGGFGGGGGGSW